MPKRIPYARLGPALVFVRDESKAERDRFYSGTRWRRFRAWFLRRHPLCLDCEARGLTVAAEIPHHLIERLADERLAYSEENLVPLCSPCHTRRHKGTHGSDS